MALWMAWKIFTDIEKDKAFTMENAKRMGNVSFLAAADAVLLVVGNVVYLILHMNHPGVLLASFLIALVGTAIAIAAAMLSHLIRKAARLLRRRILSVRGREIRKNLREEPMIPWMIQEMCWMTTAWLRPE